MGKVVAVILAGGAGTRLSILTAERAKPGLPFGGRYRTIDFTLSNCVNSGITKVTVLTQYSPRSLALHLGAGRAWDLDRIEGGLYVLQPFLIRDGGSWYGGTADALRQNQRFIEQQGAERILVLAGDHVYTMNYEDMIAHRVSSWAANELATTARWPVASYGDWPQAAGPRTRVIPSRAPSQ